MIRLACARDAAVELRYERADGTCVRGRTRLLEETPEWILADAPSYERQDVRIPAHRPVSVFLMLNGKRYEFATIIEDDAVKIRLNAEQQVRGLQLRRPAMILESQRRAHFRVSLAASDPIGVTVAACHPRFRDACAIDVQPAHGRLLNISAGGVALLLSTRELRRVRVNDCFYLGFGLPEVEGEFNMLATVRHAVSVPSSESVRVGTAFLPWSGIDLRADLRRIVGFIADCERRSLRRRK